LETIERGLRRLATKTHTPGGQYGRWLERYFGLPPELESYLRWLGQYHSRFADLPVSLRRRQLETWDRPPLCDAAAGIWIDLGVASLGFRHIDAAVLEARLKRATQKLSRAPVAAVIEHALLRARVHDPRGTWLAAAAQRLDDDALGEEDAACYRARVSDAKAYRAMRSGPPSPERYAAGRALYESISDASGVPFVDFKRTLGLAYCEWKNGDTEQALALALEAAEHAGDGGFVRFRVMAFNLASRIAEGHTAKRLIARAERLSERLEDEELLSRIRKPRG